MRKILLVCLILLFVNPLFAKTLGFDRYDWRVGIPTALSIACIVIGFAGMESANKIEDPNLQAWSRMCGWTVVLGGCIGIYAVIYEW